MAQLIEGRAVAETGYAESRVEISSLKERGTSPGLAVVLVGDDPASRAYVRSKDKKCKDLGLHSVKLELPATTTRPSCYPRCTGSMPILPSTASSSRARRQRISMKRPSFVPLIRQRMSMAFIP